MKHDFQFCPRCKNKILIDDEKVLCPECKFEIYFDVAATVSTIPIKDGKILIAIRKSDPFKGTIDLIGGFLKANESAEEAIVRETYEETGLKIKIEKYFKSYPDVYGKGGKPLLGITFITSIISGAPKANDDVAELKWVPIKDIPKLKFNGFENIKTALTDFYNDYFSRGAEN